MAKENNGGSKPVKSKVNNKGVNAKSKTSKIKTSKNYKKPYNSQGR